MNKIKAVEKIARSIYYANWKELSNGRFPPVWESTSEEIREWVRNQARAVLDERPGSINPPVRLGQGVSTLDVPGN